jgi:hypothetical protein
MAFATDSANVAGGAGGSSFLGRGGGYTCATGTSSVVGAAASGYGAGGAGAAAAATGVARAGGDGSDGVIIIWEYS